MNEAKKKILENAINPVTIKEIHEATKLKYPNLSKHIKELKDRGLLLDIGNKGKFKIVQTNKFMLKEKLNKEIDERKKMLEKVM